MTQTLIRIGCTGKIFYGYEEGVDIDLGDNCFYKVILDEKGCLTLTLSP